jgi:hypothetical protein
MKFNGLKKLVFFVAYCILCSFLLPSCQRNTRRSLNDLRFAISFTRDVSKASLDGRIFLMISSDGSLEPRFQINSGPDTQLIFGLDVDELKPGDEAIIDKSVFGYPLKSLSEIPAGEYWVQGLLHRYEIFHRADGHIVKLPMDRGEGQQWNLAPGNLFNNPQKMWIDPKKSGLIKISLDKIIPPIPPPAETKYIKHVKIQSQLLTKFWGRPMYLGAHVLLPEGYGEHPNAEYPLVINLGHFAYTFEGFRETPPDPNLKPVYSERFKIQGYNKIVQEYAYKFYQYWTAPDTPRMIIIRIQDPNPYYDDSYAVNSSNVGPYGDAITYELIPFIEKKFRCIGKGWARFLYGGSTGGWEVLADQIFYPTEYNGCWSFCPDPIDFRAYTVVNIYEDKNAYYLDSQWKHTPRPGSRNYLGQIRDTLEEINHLELVLGTKGRSGEQFDIHQAVFSPVGDDGYPKPIKDKMTGEIDHSVAEYWRQHYDLRYILNRDWKKIGPYLKGKIHIYVGEMDSIYLNDAVYLMEDFLESTKDPYYEGVVDYGARSEHCWTGDHKNPNSISRLTIEERFIPLILERLLKTAPAGSDTKSWRY